MNENFVYIVGYNLEKVHGGVIKWLLDIKNMEVPFEDKYSILTQIYDANPPFGKKDIKEIKVIPEYSFGRKMRIDSVVEITTFNDKKYALVMEYKTDSDVNIGQLKSIVENFTQKDPTTDSLFILLLFGPSQFTYQHIEKEITEIGFKIFNLDKLISIFSDLSLRNTSKIYNDWISALKEEKNRIVNINEFLKNCGSLKNQNYWIDLKYRGFPSLYYPIYGKLRELFEKGKYNKWEIRSGNNNPVLNWRGGWIHKKYNDKGWSLFWEFNRDWFCLKVEIDGKNPLTMDELSHHKNKVKNFCKASTIEGKETKMKTGTWISFYKWEFDFSKVSFPNVVQDVNRILDEIHPRLMEI